ncbi:MAG: hypothetical protein ABSE73_25455 [Planctomycetota bacterium]
MVEGPSGEEHSTRIDLLHVGRPPGAPTPPLDDPLGHPLDPCVARDLARWILENGRVRFPSHAFRRMKEASPVLTQMDVTNAIRAGKYQAPEIQNGEWRYLIHTQRLRVAIAFDSSRELVVCTAGRFK